MDRSNDLTTPPPMWEVGNNIELNNEAVLLNLDLDAELAITLAAAEALLEEPKSAWAKYKLELIHEHRNRGGKLNLRCKWAELGGPQGMWVPMEELLLVEEHKLGVANYLRAVKTCLRANSWTALRKKFPIVEELINFQP